MRHLLALSLALLGTPAFAGPPPAALGVMLDLTRAEDTVEIADPAFSGVAAGRVPLQFGETTLESLAARFGGTVEVDRSLGVGLAWLCYLVPQGDGTSRVSFLGTAGEDGTDNPLLGLAVEPADPATDAEFDCAAATGETPTPELGIPGRGARRPEIAAHYGVELPGTERLNIVHESLENGRLVLQQLQYRLSGGAVTAVAFTQSTL